jgi:transcriptional regulator with XRE-family HTH domain
MRSTAQRQRTDDDVLALEALGQRIRALRKAQLIQQDVLAGYADIPRAHMTHIEAGKVDLRHSMLRRIAIALSVSVVELIDPDISIEELSGRFVVDDDSSLIETRQPKLKRTTKVPINTLKASPVSRARPKTGATISAKRGTRK